MTGCSGGRVGGPLEIWEEGRQIWTGVHSWGERVRARAGAADRGQGSRWRGDKGLEGGRAKAGEEAR